MAEPEHLRVQGQRSRARGVGTAASLTLEEWNQTVADFKGLCAYCQKRPYEVLEHFLPVYIAGTQVSNCIPACYKCNYKKSDHTGTTLIDLFGQATIDRIKHYLASRTGSGEPAFSKQPQRKARWSTRKKSNRHIPPHIEEQPTYDIRDLYDLLTFPDVELTRKCRMGIKTLYRVVCGDKVHLPIVDKLLKELSIAYGKTFTLQNVTGINVQVNKRLEKREAKQQQASPLS